MMMMDSAHGHSSFTDANLRPPSGQNLESNCSDSTPTQGLDDVTQKVLKNISQFHLRNQKKKKKVDSQINLS